jgi:serine/threonine-protein kinase RsbT
MLPITAEDDVVVVRRKVRELAEDCGFDSFATAALSTATSELTRNVWVHGGGGQAHIQVLEDGGRMGIRVAFADNGPGISNVERALAGGFSTARSLGLGLSGSRRLVDEFLLDTREGEGTCVTITKWTRHARLR